MSKTLDRQKADIWLFWLKSIIGFLSGFSYYLFIRLLYNYVFINVPMILTAISIPISIFLYVFLCHFIILLIFYLINKNFNFINFNQVKLWNFTLNYFWTFIFVFLISATIAFSINF